VGLGTGVDLTFFNAASSSCISRGGGGNFTAAVYLLSGYTQYK